MYYKKIAVHTNLIVEFHSDWLGLETVSVNGQLVSRKSSVQGTHHPFNVIESGRVSNYILSSKLLFDGEAAIDLRRNQQIIFENVIVPMSGVRKRESSSSRGFGLGDMITESKLKKSGLTKLQAYNLQDAVADFKEALKIDAKDPETYFHLACAYSVLELKTEAFDCLAKAVEYGLENKDVIMTHEMLAFVRMQDEFEGFAHRGFKA